MGWESQFNPSKKLAARGASPTRDARTRVYVAIDILPSTWG